ncbi:MAG: energy transducer TonB [Alphaproteobacteria bacterium]|nr:energy transducer TonB [Alphaproteobacteria bacterium]
MKTYLATISVLSLVLNPILLEARAQPVVGAGTELCSDKIAQPGFAPAVLVTRSPPVFPESDAASESEGWFRLGFTIDAEGETKDVVVLDQVGSAGMAKAARQAVARWKYKPATQDGQPIEQHANSAEIVFRAKHVGNAPIHEEVVANYDEGRGLVAEGKYAEGIAVLERTFELPVTLYEQAKLSFALAFAYERSNDPSRALVHIRHAVIEGGRYLEKTVVPAAQRMRMRLEVAKGNFHYAACAAPLPATDNFDATGADRKATMKVLDDAMRRLASAEPLVVDAALTKLSGARGGLWEHPLSRRKFKFSSFTGEVREFRLSCVTQMTDGPVNETAQWSVPRAAGPCILRVSGEVGASFKLIEEW